jgi:hypothetical protein
MDQFRSERTQVIKVVALDVGSTHDQLKILFQSKGVVFGVTVHSETSRYFHVDLTLHIGLCGPVQNPTACSANRAVHTL